ncbi:hypothetical protein [Streptomyces sp. HNM0574]|uniref:hypothetical protein n=1 Tax=Streptomyces sp. HNM0574 TaxID=2714954 RepID=UPI00146CB0AA|nr:hypothetical protein [Streptomyces sp. HNM0574]NLU70709.1 hypothetical protein [Streptomyces sp. HNM0574]
MSGTPAPSRSLPEKPSTMARPHRLHPEERHRLHATPGRCGPYVVGARRTRAFGDVNDAAPPPRAAAELYTYPRESGAGSPVLRDRAARPQELSRRIAFFLGAGTETSASFFAHLPLRYAAERPAVEMRLGAVGEGGLAFVVLQQAGLILREPARRAPYAFGAIRCTGTVMTHSVDALPTARAPLAACGAPGTDSTRQESA